MEAAFGYIDFDKPLAEDDFSRPPSSGIEYLRRVQYEASRCPEVVIANVPKKLQTPECSVHYQRPQPLTDAPNQKIQRTQAADFAQIRQRINRYKTQSKNIASVKLPKKQNAQTWCAFCFGHEFLKKCYKGRLSEEAISEETKSNGHEPLLSIIAQFTQPLAVQILEYQLIWLDLCGFSTEQGRWIYSLMLCIDKPTPQDAMSVLRTIARKCLKIRDLHNEQSDLVSQLNLFIVIVSKYFGQEDLALY